MFTDMLAVGTDVGGGIDLANPDISDSFSLAANTNKVINLQEEPRLIRIVCYFAGGGNSYEDYINADSKQLMMTRFLNNAIQSPYDDRIILYNSGGIADNYRLDLNNKTFTISHSSYTRNYKVKVWY